MAKNNALFKFTNIGLLISVIAMAAAVVAAHFKAINRFNEEIGKIRNTEIADIRLQIERYQPLAKAAEAEARIAEISDKLDSYCARLDRISAPAESQIYLRSLRTGLTLTHVLLIRFPQQAPQEEALKNLERKLHDELGGWSRLSIEVYVDDASGASELTRHWLYLSAISEKHVDKIAEIADYIPRLDCSSSMCIVLPVSTLAEMGS